jgi:hypothetical protein
MSSGDEAALLGLGLEDLENQLLLAQGGRTLDTETLGHLDHIRDAHLLEDPDVQRVLLVFLVFSPVSISATSRPRSVRRSSLTR